MELSRKQFDILEVFATAKETTPTEELTQRKVAELTNQSLGNVNRLLKELDGLVDNGKITTEGLLALEPYRVKKAIFLAAGVGIRLMPVTLNTPKPLIRVNGKRIIDELIEACLGIGIQEIYIVRGYLSEQFEQLKLKYPMIQFIENPAFNEANNISSALCARYLLSNAYVFEADLIVNPVVLKKYHYQSDFLTCYMDRVDDWCFEVQNGMITNEKLGGFNAWRNCGISYWNEEDGLKLAGHLKEAYEMPGGKEYFWEQVPLSLYRGSYKVLAIECNEQDIIEIDTYKELKNLDGSYKFH